MWKYGIYMRSEEILWFLNYMEYDIRSHSTGWNLVQVIVRETVLHEDFKFGILYV